MSTGMSPFFLAILVGICLAPLITLVDKDLREKQQQANKNVDEYDLPLFDSNNSGSPPAG